MCSGTPYSMMNEQRLCLVFLSFALFVWYTVINPHLWIYTSVSALLLKDLLLPHSVSVEYFPFWRFTPYCRSVLYLLLIGSMSDIVSLCRVYFKLAFDSSIPIPNISEITSADIFVCLLVE